MKEQTRLIIHGKVQGVFFRDATRKKARDLNVHGWVRNNPDGTVEILCQGNPENIQNLIDWCYKGPSSAEVSRVDVQKQFPENEELFDSFEIRY